MPDNLGSGHLSVKGLRQESLEAVSDDPVAFARGRLQSFPVEHCDRTAAVTAQPRLLQRADDGSDLRPRHA